MFGISSFEGRDLAADVVFLAAMATGSAFTVFMLSSSWPSGAWHLDLGVAIALAVCVLLRRVGLVAASALGMGVAGVAVVVASAADLPQEPGPITGLAVAVLVATCVRRGSTSLAAASLTGATILLALSWFLARPQQGGFTAVTILLGLNLIAGACCGVAARVLDTRTGRRRRSPAGFGN